MTPPPTRPGGAFDVHDFNQDRLKDLLVEHSHERNENVRDKPHVDYLHGYLEELGCRTLVVERDYTDRSFLEDYAAYYVRCFEPYRRTCTRLHFFSRNLDRDALIDAITADRAQALQPHYLGFVVVKPLPLTVIGRTCLAPYPEGGERARRYPTVQPQTANLFGLKLGVATLPFQEQDREVAACASSALWTLMHSTAHVFQHAILSPAEITRTASAQSRLEARTFPNGDGLNSLQIADAIRSVGLEPLGIRVSSVPRVAAAPEKYGDEREDTRQQAPAEQRREAANAAQMQVELKLAALAYMRSGIACLLLCRTRDVVDERPVVRGNHAVALTGYGLGESQGITPYGATGTLFAAARVDRLFVHDDQTGPFTRFTFEPDNMLLAADHRTAQHGFRMADPINLIIPLYHKVRIPLSQVVDLTVRLDQALRSLGTVLNWRKRIVWDVQLNSIETVRDEIAASRDLDRQQKFDLLTNPMPRYIWRVSAAYGSKPAFDLLLDATDLLQGDLVRKVVAYDKARCLQAGHALKPLTGRLPPSLRSVARHFTASVKATSTERTTR